MDEHEIDVDRGPADTSTPGRDLTSKKRVRAGDSGEVVGDLLKEASIIVASDGIDQLSVEAKKQKMGSEGLGVKKCDSTESNEAPPISRDNEIDLNVPKVQDEDPDVGI